MPLDLLKRCLAAAAACAALAAAPAAAETLFAAVIDGPTAGTPSPATGSAALILNDAEDEVRYVVEFSGLTAFQTGAHFHRGGPGETGPVLLGLGWGTPRTGVWSVGPTEVALLREGRVYVNIHSDVYHEGEIRGNIAYQGVSDEGRAWGAVKALFR